MESGLRNVPTTPRSLREALNLLDSNREFLLRGDVFTPDIINTWISYKMENEVESTDYAHIHGNLHCIKIYGFNKI